MGKIYYYIHHGFASVFSQTSRHFNSVDNVNSKYNPVIPHLSALMGIILKKKKKPLTLTGKKQKVASCFYFSNYF